MKYELKNFQIDATKELLSNMAAARDMYYQHRMPASCCLAAPTGGGKTVMAAAAIEAIFNGNLEWSVERDSRACILWVCDSPSLNNQTLQKFLAASDLDSSLIETIENTFTQENDTLKAGHIYFLNRQKLGSGNLLVKGGETLTFWQLLRDTIANPDIHLYMVLDEAHKGLGKEDKADSDKDTIYAKIIDGENKDAPIPVVVGISATPQRFQKAMENRAGRTTLPITKVSPKDVQESGLLKEKIVLSVPSAGDAVTGLYLANACKALADTTKQWANWCAANDVATIYPLMVVQVPDNVSDDRLQDLCTEIGSHISWIDRSTAYGNVFGSHKAVHLNGFDIPYVLPEDVQRKTDIRVLFAKEAVSTGWDCPRAEVIYSMRPHKDGTYIAQLVGRMVRTPLARTVDVDVLNSVRCFLPHFDPNTVEKVVDYLTTEGSDDFSGVSENSGRKVITNPIDVVWDSSLGVDEAFESICMKTRFAQKTSWINGALSYTGLLAKYEIDLDAEDELLDALLRELNDAITIHHDEHESAKANVTHAESIDYTFQYLDSSTLSKNMYTQNADTYALRHARENADSILTKALTNRYFRQELLAGRTEVETNVSIAAAVKIQAVVDAVTACAKTMLEALTKKYDKEVSQCPEPVRADFTAKLYQNGIEHVVYLRCPQADVQSLDHKKFAKHVMNDPQTHMAYIDIRDQECEVVNHELKSGRVAWYRNQKGGGNGCVLSIPYRYNDNHRSMYPDFIFFDRMKDGSIMPAIIDPHGVYLDDSLDKLKGLAVHVEEFGDTYSRVWSVDKVDGTLLYIDMKDPNVRAYLDKAKKAIEVFNEFGKPY